MDYHPTTIFILDTLKSAIQEGIQAWERAGTAVLQLIDHGMTLEQIAEAANNEFVTVNVLAQFERIGRKQVLPQLLVANFPASRYLKRLPMSEQQRLVDGTIELLLERESGTDTLQVHTRHMTKDQCRQAFDKGAVRTLGAQRAWLEGERHERLLSKPTKASAPWHIRNGKVVFSAECEMSRQELAIVLAQMQ